MHKYYPSQTPLCGTIQDLLLLLLYRSIELSPRIDFALFRFSKNAAEVED